MSWQNAWISHLPASDTRVFHQSLNVHLHYVYILVLFVYTIGSDTNCRVTPKSMSTLLLSKSDHNLYFEKSFTSKFSSDIIAFYLSNRKDGFCYSLHDICSDMRIRRLPKDEDKAGLNLMAKILNLDKHMEVHLTRDKEIQHFKDIEIPGISSRIKPDLSVYNKSKNVYVEFIEVESETLESTVRKMYFVLLLQLIQVRICGNSISAVTGLVLPKLQNKSGCIVAATVT